MKIMYQDLIFNFLDTSCFHFRWSNWSFIDENLFLRLVIYHRNLFRLDKITRKETRIDRNRRTNDTLINEMTAVKSTLKIWCDIFIFWMMSLWGWRRIIDMLLFFKFTSFFFPLSIIQLQRFVVIEIRTVWLMLFWEHHFKICLRLSKLD